MFLKLRKRGFVQCVQNIREIIGILKLRKKIRPVVLTQGPNQRVSVFSADPPKKSAVPSV